MGLTELHTQEFTVGLYQGVYRAVYTGVYCAYTKGFTELYTKGFTEQRYQCLLSMVTFEFCSFCTPRSKVL